MKKYAVIAAAGSGRRMGHETPKQFLTVAREPVLFHTLKAFVDAFPDIIPVIVAQKSGMDTARTIAARVGGRHTAILVEGADTRTGSVKAGLDAIDDDDSIVFIHDAARCLVTPILIKRCFETALDKGNAIPAMASVNSVRIGDRDHSEPADRQRVWLIQTPQTFKTALIRAAYAAAGDREFTDDAEVADHSGISIQLVEGETSNIKITTPVDLVIAEKVLGERHPEGQHT